MRFLASIRLCGRFGMGLLACGQAAAMSSTQVMQRPSSVWGEVPLEQEGLVVGGVEVLTALLVTSALLVFIAGGVLLQAWNLLQRARLAEGAEIEHLWFRVTKVQRWASSVAYVLMPVTAIATLVLAPTRTLFGFGIAELVLGLFLLGIAISGVAFLVLEAGRSSLGSQKL